MPESPECGHPGAQTPLLSSLVPTHQWLSGLILHYPRNQCWVLQCFSLSSGRSLDHGFKGNLSKGESSSEEKGPTESSGKQEVQATSHSRGEENPMNFVSIGQSTPTPPTDHQHSAKHLSLLFLCPLVERVPKPRSSDSKIHIFLFS